MEEVSLTIEDWKEARCGARSLLKNAMAQVVVYKAQLETAEREIERLTPPLVEAA